MSQLGACSMELARRIGRKENHWPGPMQCVLAIEDEVSERCATRRAIAARKQHTRNAFEGAAGVSR